jgi:phosphoglycerate dehydrogenase-like enzyme
MDKTKLLVLANASQPELALLDRLPVLATVGDDLAATERPVSGAEVILCWPGPSRLLERLWPLVRNVRWVHCVSAGLDGFLFPALIDSNVPVTNSRGVFSDSLGEFVIGAVLFFAKDFRRMIRNQAAEVWDPFDVEEISGQTIGILGYGSIGRAVALRAKAMGMRVMALRRTPGTAPPDPSVDEMLPQHRKLELIAGCDYLVVTAPLTPETFGMIGPDEFEAMKPGAVVINVGRGPVVDETSLIRALLEEKIRGAALDVFNTEPLPKDHPFYRMENVLLSPHCADHTPRWLRSAMGLFADNLGRFRRGEPLQNVVDKKRGY